MGLSTDAIIAIVFYVAVALLIYLNRKKFSFEAKIIAMYRAKWGIKLMHHWGDKATKLIKVLGVIGIVIGFAGMGTAVWLIIDGFYKLLFVPGAPPTFAPVIPGVKIPGLDFRVPLMAGIIALFVSVVIHEFSHGVVAAAHKMRIKHSGIVFFGPLPGAFVEPDEKQLTKQPAKAQLSVYAAGPFSNILLTILLIILFGFLPIFADAMGADTTGVEKFTRYTSVVNFAQIREELYEPAGIRLLGVLPASGAEEAGLTNTSFISSINGHSITNNATAFGDEIVKLANLTPGQVVTMANDNQTWIIVAKPHTDNESKGQLGIIYNNYIETRKNPETLEKYGVVGFAIVEYLMMQLFWIILLSSGLGLANLLPLGPVDGGRMLLTALEQFLPKKKARLIWAKTSMVIFASVIILVVVPIIKGIIF